MTSATKINSPKLNLDEKTSFDNVGTARNYGIVLGVLTSIYLVIINLSYGNGGEEVVGVPIGARFAKHLLIIPVLWMAITTYAKTMTKGHIFKGGLELFARIAMWAALTIGALNLAFFMITSSSFEQFLNEGETFLTATVNSGFLIFETVVFVMIVGFIILQAFKDGGSPED
jgi:hypothetical protein